jgi:glycosyltransferase involved in cell wall biosynthesis
MRIGVDLFSFDPEYSGGVSTFSLGLVEGLLANLDEDATLTLLVTPLNKNYIKKQFAGRNIKLFILKRSILNRIINRAIIYLSWLIQEYRLRYWYELFIQKTLNRGVESAVDALIVPTTVLNFYALRIPTILCIHDIQQEYHPENFTFHQRVLRWSTYRLSCYKATTIQVSSRYIQDCLLDKFKFLSPQSFLIAPEGVDISKFSVVAVDRVPKSLPNTIRQDFLFYPAQIWKHKNHEVLMRALSICRLRLGFEIPCVLTGFDYGFWKEINKTREELSLNSVYYLGRVDLQELVWLYKKCSAVLALGLHESSSLPLREGASFGKPLICADIPPNIEALDSLHLNIFEGNSPDSLAEEFLKITEKNSNIYELATQNKYLVASLSWKVIALLYLEKLKFNPKK